MHMHITAQGVERIRNPTAYLTAPEWTAACGDRIEVPALGFNLMTFSVWKAWQAEGRRPPVTCPKCLVLIDQALENRKEPDDANN